MSPNDKKSAETKTTIPDPSRTEKRDEAKKLPAIDFAKLDLTIEKVEERISPSETNVFDK
jgi:hypothetical protein